jgi:hypothetical protein
MLFQHSLIDKLIFQSKTQTRRPVKPNHYYLERDRVVLAQRERTTDIPVYKVGKTYPVQPGRGKPGLYWNPRTHETNEAWLRDCKTAGMNVSVWGDAASALAGYVPLRIRITDIRREDVRNISDKDALAEGFKSEFPHENKWLFIQLWARLYDPIASWKFDPQRVDYWLGKGRNKELVSWQDVQAQIASRPADLYDAWALTFQVERG